MNWQHCKLSAFLCDKPRDIQGVMWHFPQLGKHVQSQRNASSSRLTATLHFYRSGQSSTSHPNTTNYDKNLSCSRSPGIPKRQSAINDSLVPKSGPNRNPSNNNNNSNNHDDIYSAVIYDTSHMREFTVVHLGQSRSAPGGRQLVGQAANLTFESACRLLQTEHSPIAMYYYSTIRLILVYRPSEGGRLSRPTCRHCSKCAACAKAAYRSDFRENTNFCPQHDSNLGPLAQQASVLPLDHCDHS